MNWMIGYQCIKYLTDCLCINIIFPSRLMVPAHKKKEIYKLEQK